MTSTTSPGVLNTFFSSMGTTSIGTIADPELKELITALRFIQLDRSLLATDATAKITETMITNMARVTDTNIPTGNDILSFEVPSSAEKEKVNGFHQFNYIQNTAAPGSNSAKYEYVKLDVEMKEGKYEVKKVVNKEDDDSLSNRYDTVHNFLVKEKLSELVDEKVFKLFSTPVKDIDSLSNGSKAFKYLKFDSNNHLYNKSFIDIILDLEKYTQHTTVLETEKESNEDKYELFKSIYDFLVKVDTVSIPDENSLIMDIVKFQNNIDKSKQNIKEERNKIYTYLSRDKNYTKTLKTKRTMLYLSIAALVIISILYGGVLYNKSMSDPDKTTVVVVVASLVLFVNMILYIIRFTFQSRETFVSDNDALTLEPIVGFAYKDSSENTIDVKEIMVNFSMKYAEILSKEIKNEYYDALYISQEKDKKLLDQLEKEHSIKSHFHQLKNNLTHFKINETKEYSKLSQLAIVLVSLVAILYLTVLQDTIDMKIFNIVAGLTLVIYVTYVLLTVKSIMLRDKYDWDRFHWTVKNVKSNMNPEQCPLPGFPN